MKLTSTMTPGALNIARSLRQKESEPVEETESLKKIDPVVKKIFFAFHSDSKTNDDASYADQLKIDLHETEDKTKQIIVARIPNCHLQMYGDRGAATLVEQGFSQFLTVPFLLGEKQIGVIIACGRPIPNPAA